MTAADYQLTMEYKPDFNWLDSGYWATLIIRSIRYCRSGSTPQEAKINVFEDYQGAINNWEDFFNDEPEETLECFACGQSFNSLEEYQGHIEIRYWSADYAPAEICHYDDEVE